jgi:hypothetical protein
MTIENYIAVKCNALDIGEVYSGRTFMCVIAKNRPIALFLVSTVQIYLTASEY